MPAKKTVSLPFKATEKQEPFVNSSAMFKLGGGARGGGKSHTLAGIAVLLSFFFPGNVGYMGRADLLDFKKTTLPLVLDLIPKELLVKHQAQEHYIDILCVDGKSTSRMWYGEMKDPGSLLSGNIGWFFIDEAYEVPLETFVNLQGALRGMLPDGSPRPFYGLLASNPAPGWLMESFPVLEEEQELFNEAVKKEGPNFTPFVSPYSTDPDNPKYIDPDYAYFPFRARDNEFAGGEAYEARLIKQYSKLGPTWVSRMVYGVWDASMEGLVYQLQPPHIWQPKRPGQRLYRPGVPVELAGDPSNGAGVYAINAIQRWRGRVLIIDEFHQPGGTDEDARAWLDSAPWRDDVSDGIFDPAKPDTIKRLRSWGYPVRGMTKKKNVTDQINAFKQGLAIDPVSGQATVVIDGTYCPMLLDEMRKRVYRKPNSRIKGARVSEQPVKANDHHCNAVEYWFHQKMAFTEDLVNQYPDPVYEARAYLRLAY